jgi:TonB family protein
MNAAIEPQTLAWVHALGWTLLHFLWQGALIGALFALFRALTGRARPQSRYAGGLIALALLALAPIATLWQVAPWDPAQVAAVARPDAVASVSGASTTEAEVSEAAIPHVTGDSRLEPLLPWVVVLWLLGVALAATRALFAYRRLARLCREHAEPLTEWEPKLRDLIQRFGITRPVRLLRSAVVRTPSLIGWLAPVIVIPTGVIVGLAPRQIELVIAHELGHIRRWDYLVNLLQIAIETVLFYHPVVHWISREVRNEREASCDDLVLRLGADRVAYAETLASLEELHQFAPVPVLAASGGFLLGRIRRIIGAEPALSAPQSGGQGLLLAVIALAVLLAAQPVSRTVLDRTPRSEPASVPLAGSPAATLAGAAIATLDRAMAAVVSVQESRGAMPHTPLLAAAPTAGIDSIAVPDLSPPAPARLALALPKPLRAMHGAAGELAFNDLVPRIVRARPQLALPADEHARATATVAPSYPREAAVRGIEGAVSLSFLIDARGRAHQIAVIEVTEPGVFEQAAKAALREWRFDPDRRSPGRRYTQTFEFALDSRSGIGLDCQKPLGSRICR